MKKSLLLSLMATASMTAFAVKPVADAEPVQLNDNNAAEATAVVTSEAVNFAAETASPITPKADDVKIFPRYALPGGAFFMYGIGDFAASSGLDWNYLSIPAYCPLTWKNTTYTTGGTATEAQLAPQWYATQLAINPATGQYGVQDLITEDKDLVTPAYPYGLGWPQSFPGIPELTVNSNTFIITDPYIGGTGASVARMRTYTRSRINFSDVGLKHMKFTRLQVGLFTGNPTAAALAETDSVFAVRANAFGLSSTAGNAKTGFYLPASPTVYGMFGAIYTATISSFRPTSSMNFEVYVVESRAKQKPDGPEGRLIYTLGKKLGEGSLAGDKVQLNPTTTYNYFIPAMEKIGDFEMESYINIPANTPVAVLFSGWDMTSPSSGVWEGDVVVPSLAMGCNDNVDSEGIIVTTDGDVVSSATFGFADYPAPGLRAVCINYQCGVNAIMGALAAYDEDDYYTFNAATAGESKTFEFEPSMDLNDESGMAIIDGEGAFDWYEYTVGEYDENTGLQTITVKVNALPASVNGRSSDLLVKIPGAEQVIKITQGEVSGIDSVANDAAVVSSTYFDLMGRELNAEPETGMFIRQDVKADGSKVATKVVK